MAVAVGAFLFSIPFLTGSADSELERVGQSAVTGSARVMLSDPVRVRRSEKCRSARNAVAYYRARTYERQAAREGRLATRSPIARGKSCRWARYAAAEWQARARSAARRLEAWTEYHYHWWKWLPANWQALGACETGYGQRPGNFEHANSSFVSAFGISRSIYGRDADYHGVPHWDDANPPTPREQYLAALGHLALWGDGWTCPGP